MCQQNNGALEDIVTKMGNFTQSCDASIFDPRDGVDKENVDVSNAINKTLGEILNGKPSYSESKTQPGRKNNNVRIQIAEMIKEIAGYKMVFNKLVALTHKYKQG